MLILNLKCCFIYSLDFDPRTRHTVWTSIFGGYFQWLPYFAATHSQVQRYISMPSLSSIRRCENNLVTILIKINV